MQNDLTARELLILEMLLKGMSPKEISFNLNVKYATVDYHKGRIYRKLGVRSIQELFVKYGKPEIEYSADDKPEASDAVTVSIVPDDSVVPSLNLPEKKTVKTVPILTAALAVSLLFNAAMIIAFILINSNNHEEVKSIKSFASPQEPLQITLIYGQPGGYNFNFNLFDCFVPQIFAGDSYVWHYAFTSDSDMNDLSVALVDRSDEASEGCWVALTAVPPFAHAIKANVEYRGAVRLKTYKSAYSDRTISNLFEFGTDNFPDKPPVLTFTRFDVEKENL